MKFTIRKVTLILEELKQELAKREAQLTVLGEAYADFEQDIKRFNTERENITHDMTQAAIWKQNWSESNS